MLKLFAFSRAQRGKRWKTLVGLPAGLVVLMFLLTVASAASELTLITPPSNPSLKRSLPVLSSYLTEKLDGVRGIRPIIAQSYNQAGQRFEASHGSLIYAGSFLTYVLCARNLAVPLARGEQKAGFSTYRSVLLTGKNTPFHGVESVRGRRLTYVTEASAGNVFARWFFGGEDPASVADTTYVPAKTHEVAVRLVHGGRADFAFVKSSAWEALKAEYPNLHVVARDAGEYPDNVLLASPETYRVHGKRLQSILLGMDSDPDERAKQILDALELERFVPTLYPDEFRPTATLVRDAGLNPTTYRFSR